MASSLSPEDPEIAFNHAAVLEASQYHLHRYLHRFVLTPILKAGKLEEALEKYKLSKEFGVERAAMHIRNVSRTSCQFNPSMRVQGIHFQVSAKILGNKMKQAEAAKDLPDGKSS